MFLGSQYAKTIALTLMLSGTVAVHSATSLTRDGGEYRILFSIPGDQVHPALALGASGGYLVTEDNSVDGSGLGLRARKYNSDFSGSRTTFGVNTVVDNDQKNARVAMLSNGGAVFVWQTTVSSGYQVAVRFLSGNQTFISPELSVGTVGAYQQNPSVAVLADDSVVIVWSSFDLDGHLDGVFGQRFSSTGQPLSTEFRVNQGTLFSQRNPGVAGLANGTFVVVWISEEQRAAETVDVFGRLFTGTGQALGNEFRVNTSTNQCADPVVTRVNDLGFTVAWSELNLTTPDADRDIYARSFNVSAEPASGAVLVNATHTHGDQYTPQIASLGTKQLIVWTALGQDGSAEGVYGQLVSFFGQREGDQFLINTTTVSKQMHPAVATDGKNEFVVAWTSYTGGTASFDLFGQRFQLLASELLPAPPAPFVSALSQETIYVAWPESLGQSTLHYLLYIDDETSPVQVTGGIYKATRPEWQAGSAHSFRIAYVLQDGRTSPQSAAATGRTWGADLNGDGLPDEWQRAYWGDNPVNWPPTNADPDEDGATIYQEFLAGTNPIDPASVLKTQLVSRDTGLYLEWNTAPGSVYQVQVTGDFKDWQNLDTVRFAASTSDSIQVSAPRGLKYYRIIRMR